MNNERIARLLQFIEEDPHDPFNLYCLATEYKEHNPEKALEYYRQLLSGQGDSLALRELQNLQNNLLWD